MHYHQFDHIDVHDCNAWDTYSYYNGPLIMVPPESMSDVSDPYNGPPDPLSTHLLQLSASIYSNNNDDCNNEIYDKGSWKIKPVKQWESVDIIHWINAEAQLLGVVCTDIHGPNFSKLDGMKLIEMTESDFEECDKTYGKTLYKRLQKVIKSHKNYPTMLPMSEEESHEQTYTILDSTPESKKNISISAIKSPFSSDLEDVDNLSSGYDRNTSSDSSLIMSHLNETKKKDRKLSSPVPALGEKKKRQGPGRPSSGRKKSKKQEKKLGRLWEFIRDLLKNPEYCPGIIRWEDHDQGMFRFVQSDRVAKLWGNKKGNEDMNYEKLSRAMRYYYKSRVLEAVLGRRLVYRFGPNAKNWRVDNPNFEN